MEIKKPLFKPTVICLEPKMVKQFTLVFPKEMEITPEMVQSVTKPKFKLIDKKIVWDDIEIELIDYIGPSNTTKVLDLVENQCKKDCKINLSLLSLDPTGVPIEKWDLIGCEIKSVDFGHNDYGYDIEYKDIISEMGMGRKNTEPEYSDVLAYMRNRDWKDLFRKSKGKDQIIKIVLKIKKAELNK